MQHKGEIVEKYVRQSGISVTRVAKQLHKSRRWLYQVFENPNVPLDYILEIGKVIHHDFSEDINELKKYRQSEATNYVYDESSDTGSVEYWKNKYLNLLEQYNELLIKQNKELSGK